MRLLAFPSLRHAAVNLMIASEGLNPKQLQSVIGHASIQLTYDTPRVVPNVVPGMPRLNPGGGDYGPGMDRSWFADAAYAYANPREVGIAPPIVGDLEEARARLARESAHQEKRDLTTTVGDGGSFVGGGAPTYIADAFAAAVRARAVLPGILPTYPLPESGMVLSTPRITTGTTAGVTSTENAALTDAGGIVEELAESPVATIEASIDLSQQILDRGDPGAADVVLAEDLGRAMGARLDQQILEGTGASGQMLGLVTVTGIGTTAYTDATPTQQEAFVQFLKAAADQSVALGVAPDALLMHPRRRYWMANWRDTATGVPAVIPWPAEPLDVPGIPVTGEYLLLIRRDELRLYLGPVNFRTMFDLSGSGTLTVKVVGHQYAASLFNRRPEAIMKISGTGIADTPAFA